MASGGNEAGRDFWRKMQRLAASLPFVEDLLTAHYCAFDRQTPLHVKAAMLGAVAYFVLPDDLIPDYIPVIGYADDAAVLAMAMKLFSSHVKPEHREAAGRTLNRLRG
ncbi:MAG TPA: YkvA family protein [Xanthobacteraceae bacterium]|nr:YkvA family protein [Xanthobacteraceae bacterium]